MKELNSVTIQLGLLEQVGVEQVKAICTTLSGNTPEERVENLYKAIQIIREAIVVLKSNTKDSDLGICIFDTGVTEKNPSGYSYTRVYPWYKLKTF